MQKEEVILTIDIQQNIGNYFIGPNKVCAHYQSFPLLRIIFRSKESACASGGTPIWKYFVKFFPYILGGGGRLFVYCRFGVILVVESTTLSLKFL